MRVPLCTIVIGASAALVLATAGTAAAMSKPGSRGPRAVGDAAASGWGIVKSPNPLVRNGMVTAVSCAAANACEAVGAYPSSSSSFNDVTLAETWNGTVWKHQTTPNPPTEIYSALLGVSCTAANACEAVGYSSFGTLAEAWNGTAWSLQTTPNPAGATGSRLSGVSCTAANACEAVGSYTNSAEKGVTLAEAWNGAAWTLQTTPNPAGATGSGLSGVSCSAAGSCQADGSYTIGRREFTLVIARS
ncbi:MAG TPA: hypothetical protein VGS19_36770 [Streptosporangiaceae bacterium]|nr:hypothetical protein [Streptosporangiaceae bacterium]